MTDSRLNQASTWLASLPQYQGFLIQPLAGDASFRRYFRVTLPNQAHPSLVLMDAPPTKEDVTPFLQVQAWLEASGLTVPKLIQQDLQQGFLLLEDFGDNTWAVALSQGCASTPLFENALQQLHTLQASTTNLELPLFDVPRMQKEADLYLDWYLPHIKSHTPSPAEREKFHQVLLPSLQAIASLPQAPVHLDYHSRNLMLPKQGLPLGIIDFQDAVLGPITYDLASLLYDCYQDYPETERLAWSKHFFQTLPSQHHAHFQGDFQQWHHALRLTSMQRHIKVLGIFARLAYRDGKQQFLDEIPLTKKHFIEESNALDIQLPL
ncbi:MAG: phosphotransferase [Ghiorsea sp.]